jgi:hypothetical protein
MAVNYIFAKGDERRTYTEEERVLVSVILHKRVLETEGESDKTAVAVGQSQEPSAEEVLRVGHVGRFEDCKPLVA